MRELCHLSQLSENSAKGFRSTLGPIFAVKHDGDIYVYKNECPHLGVNLEFEKDQYLNNDGALIQCAMHGALFEKETGRCVSGPCQGESLTPVDFTIIDDVIHVNE